MDIHQRISSKIEFPQHDENSVMKTINIFGNEIRTMHQTDVYSGYQDGMYEVGDIRALMSHFESHFDESTPKVEVMFLVLSNPQVEAVRQSFVASQLGKLGLVQMLEGGAKGNNPQACVRDLCRQIEHHIRGVPHKLVLVGWSSGAVALTHATRYLRKAPHAVICLGFPLAAAMMAPHLMNFTCHVLYAVGGQSSLCPLQGMEEYRRQLPRETTLLVVEDTDKYLRHSSGCQTQANVDLGIVEAIANFIIDIENRPPMLMKKQLKRCSDPQDTAQAKRPRFDEHSQGSLIPEKPKKKLGLPRKCEQIDVKEMKKEKPKKIPKKRKEKPIKSTGKNSAKRIKTEKMTKIKEEEDFEMQSAKLEEMLMSFQNSAKSIKKEQDSIAMMNSSEEEQEDDWQEEENLEKQSQNMEAILKSLQTEAMNIKSEPDSSRIMDEFEEEEDEFADVEDIELSNNSFSVKKSPTNSSFNNFNDSMSEDDSIDTERFKEAFERLEQIPDEPESDEDDDNVFKRLKRAQKEKKRLAKVVDNVDIKELTLKAWNKNNPYGKVYTKDDIPKVKLNFVQKEWKKPKFPRKKPEIGKFSIAAMSGLRMDNIGKPVKGIKFVQRPVLVNNVLTIKKESVVPTSLVRYPKPLNIHRNILVDRKY